MKTIMLWCLAVASLLLAGCTPSESDGSQQVAYASIVAPKREASDEATVPAIVAAARRQVGRTIVYDPAYVRLVYPGGDVPIKKGVCSDVVVRALRASLNIDLQVLVHKDMTANFSDYPATWGLTKPDPNIDHRRVANLKKYFDRHDYSIAVTSNSADYLPGDVVTCTVPRNRSHIMIVSDRRATDGTPFVIHNIGSGASEEACLFRFPITGHYRIGREGVRDDARITAPQTASKERRRMIHVYVALADNQSQGIAPVPPKLGNGNDPANNLYWGAAYGVKTFLRKSPEWTLAHSPMMSSTSVLERCFFRHKSGNVMLRADAYRGSEIRTAILDFLTDAGGKSGADLVAYVGHNGLMEFQIPPGSVKTRRKGTGAIVLACMSKPYFQSRLTRLGAKSVLLTTGLMAPEAYTLTASLDGWIRKEPGTRVRERAAVAYDKYQNCGIPGARRLFYAANQ